MKYEILCYGWDSCICIDPGFQKVQSSISYPSLKKKKVPLILVSMSILVFGILALLNMLQILPLAISHVGTVLWWYEML